MSKKIWFDDSAADFKKIPDLFWAMSQWIVSEKAANIINNFDLGQGALYPVAEGVFQSDRATRIPGSYYCWIFGCVKDALLPEDCYNLREPQAAGLWFRIPWNLKDGDVAVSKQALLGPDVWIDPMLFKSLFLSARLGDALNDAGLSASLRLCRCRVN